MLPAASVSRPPVPLPLALPLALDSGPLLGSNAIDSGSSARSDVRPYLEVGPGQQEGKSESTFNRRPTGRKGEAEGTSPCVLVAE